MKLIDTHCHIDLYPRPEQLLGELERLNITTIGVTNLPSYFRQGIALTNATRRVRLALGLHPLLAEHHSPSELTAFKVLANQTSYIGEVGLDLSTIGRPTSSIQIRSFETVLQAVRDRPRLMTLHSRGAEKTVLSMLTEQGIVGAIFHWYTGPESLIEKILEAGHYFSVNPAMIRSASGQRVISRIPPQKVLTESDGPHIRVGNLPTQPGDVQLCLEYLAYVWGLSLNDASEQVAATFQSIIRPLREAKG